MYYSAESFATQRYGAFPANTKAEISKKVYTCSGINAKIESLGAVAGSSVTKKTDYLICGENAGSKLDKAHALGIRVLSPGEFFQMIGE